MINVNKQSEKNVNKQSEKPPKLPVSSCSRTAASVWHTFPKIRRPSETEKRTNRLSAVRSFCDWVTEIQLF